MPHLESFKLVLQHLQAAHRRLHRRERQRTAVAALSLDTLKDIGGLVVFSALPFVAVQALADSK